ncbi:odorant receptor 131-2-like [Gouania willdenowi]|uniref:odorant receptor 131-2-like n=1 Tax=Gouania willdenowi TaxID=441366 RepID=UPI0010558711|nr:odorant receptor 131-2-like [Gouania willdenowi]
MLYFHSANRCHEAGGGNTGNTGQRETTSGEDEVCSSCLCLASSAVCRSVFRRFWGDVHVSAECEEGDQCGTDTDEAAEDVPGPGRAETARHQTIKLSLVLCIPLLFVSTATFQSSPLILATMSLERYVAIIYPLQRPAAWRSDRTWVLILSVCVISCAYPMIGYTIGDVDPTITGFSTPVICTTVALNSSPVQMLYRAACNILFFTVVAIIILYTYVRILLETRKMRQDGESVNKAMYTVLLHGFQLLLCMLAFTRPITETLIVLHKDLNPADLFYINYFFFILLPRFLSPLIYGFRDQALRRHIQNSFLCCSKKRVQPCVRIKIQKNLLVSQKSKLGFGFSRIQRSVYSSQNK